MRNPSIQTKIQSQIDSIVFLFNDYMHLSHLIRTTMTAASVLQVKKLVPEARIPTRGSVESAGFDLYAAVDTVIPKGE